MFIQRENALKAHQHTCISYCFIQRDHAKKTILIQNLIKIFTKTHQIAHFIKIFSQGSRVIPRRVAVPTREILRDIFLLLPLYSLLSTVTMLQHSVHLQPCQN